MREHFDFIWRRDIRCALSAIYQATNESLIQSGRGDDFVNGYCLGFSTALICLAKCFDIPLEEVFETPTNTIPVK